MQSIPALHCLSDDFHYNLHVDYAFRVLLSQCILYLIQLRAYLECY